MLSLLGFLSSESPHNLHHQHTYSPCKIVNILTIKDSLIAQFVKFVVTKIPIELELAGLGLAAVNLAIISSQVAENFLTLIWSNAKNTFFQKFHDGRYLGHDQELV